MERIDDVINLICDEIISDGAEIEKINALANLVKAKANYDAIISYYYASKKTCKSIKKQLDDELEQAYCSEH